MDGTALTPTPINSIPVATPSTVQPVQNQSKKPNLIIVLLVIAIILFGVLLGVLIVKYLSINNSEEGSSSSISNSVSTEKVKNEIDTWITYSNPNLKYSIKYPPTWTLVDKSKGKLIEIYNQPDKAKQVGEIVIEKLSATPSLINQSLDTKTIGNASTNCLSDKGYKTWCYLEINKTIKLSILISKDQDETYNLILNKILATFTAALPLPKITSEQLSAGWYWGNKDQKLPGTPIFWIYTEGGKNSCWHKKEVDCQKAPSSTDKYVCPPNGWVDCMPILDEAKTIACSAEAMTWYKENCPNFLGAAL
jgi:hypothetical protein